MSKMLPEYAESFNSIHYFPSVSIIDGSPETPPYQPFFIPGLAKQMRDMPETLFIEPQLSRKLELDERLLRSTHFIYHPEWAAGRDNSSQSIFFGELNLAVDKGSLGEVYSFPVAVKPYLEGACETDVCEAAMHEYIGCVLINSTESIRTYKPLGVWIDEAHQPFLLTHFEEDAVSLDNLNLDYRGNSSSQASGTIETIDALQSSADILGLMHTLGFSHGDAQLKNFAKSDNSYGLVGDLARLRRILPPEEVLLYVDRIRSGLTNDLKFLIDSVASQFYLPTGSQVSMREVIALNLIDPYVSALMRSRSGPIYDLCKAGAIDLNAIIDDLLTRHYSAHCT